MSQDEQASSNLASINSATLGVNMPIVTLPDGSKAQTGTVGALLVNIKAYDELAGQESNVDQAKKEELEARMTASLPLLKRVGVFSLFTPEEWVQGSSPGRKFIGELAIREGV
ncbi:hypothetical protein K469DRAFT_705693 [Zopfia rhizophila CBS 207.26]|uniref:DUF7709 domain-containing protein n=1 Tax=Zopfia rhizophila CBS 207.26 TaxID=1314779 RepID=A0A6A6E5N7_9PEZI|nr:hypothetical protein K469DRAFT_705693 [Zopfia rhizophila CBS 207.26]